MRVLLAVTWYTPRNEDNISAGIFHYEQALQLKKKCDVAIFWPYDQTIIGFEKDSSSGVLTYRSGRRNGKIVSRVDVIWNYRKVIEDFKPDVIHAHVANPMGKISLLLGKFYNIPVVITEHQPIELMNLNSVGRKTIMKEVYKQSAYNACVSDDLSKKMKAEFSGITFNTIYNPVTIPHNNRRFTSVRMNGCVNCCIIASFYDKDIKGLQYLLPAIKMILRENHKIVLHIIGGGKYLNFYKSMAEALSLKKNVVFYGVCNKEKVIDIMKQMDFVVSASLFESAGVSVEEALCLGKPVVVTKSGGCNSLVDRTNAIIVDKGSIEALKDGIEAMIKKYHIFNSKKIMMDAKEKFSEEAITNRYIKIYNSVIKK